MAHCMIAHELGHCVHLERNLEGVVLPSIKPDAKNIQQMVEELGQARISANAAAETSAPQRTLSDYLSEVEIRSTVTEGINKIVKSWLKELMSDAIAYGLFGPAYLFAALHVLPSVAPLDGEHATHPPNRMRFLLLFQMLDREKGAAGEEGFFALIRKSDKATNLLEMWRNRVQSSDPQFTNPLHALAGIGLHRAFPAIIDAALSAVTRITTYRASTSVGELEDLWGRIRNLSPPNETVKDGVVSTVPLQSILNAGWLAFVSDVEQLCTTYNWTTWQCKSRLNGLIAKAVELNEIQRRWEEVS